MESKTSISMTWTKRARYKTHAFRNETNYLQDKAAFLVPGLK
jgi:hypothetical protein